MVIPDTGQVFQGVVCHIKVTYMKCGSQRSMMSDVIKEKVMCSSCDQPLFLDKDECRAFIEGKLKGGFIVCGCCGSKEKAN